MAATHPSGDDNTKGVIIQVLWTWNKTDLASIIPIRCMFVPSYWHNSSASVTYDQAFVAPGHVYECPAPCPCGVVYLILGENTDDHDKNPDYLARGEKRWWVLDLNNHQIVATTQEINPDNRIM